MPTTITIDVDPIVFKFEKKKKSSLLEYIESDEYKNDKWEIFNNVEDLIKYLNKLKNSI